MDWKRKHCDGAWGIHSTAMGCRQTASKGALLVHENAIHQKLTTARIWKILKISFPMKKIRSLSPERE